MRFNYRVVQREYPGIPKNSRGTFTFQFVIPNEVIFKTDFIAKKN